MAPRARHCEEERWSASQLEPCCGSSESATEQELPHGDVRTGGSSTRAPQEGEALTVLVPEPGQEPEDQQWGGLCRAFRFALPPEAPQPRPPGQSAGGEGLRGGRCLGGRSLFSARRLRWTAESGAGWEGVLRGPRAMLLPGGQHSGRAGAVPSQVSCAEKGEPGSVLGSGDAELGGT